ncbi:MAG: 50S ribosomal protein L11 methyltransferase [Acidobacteria bacterium]|nr:50S ribosomal protein L11 methyltransferase [Acidobacteriota bacterium]
MGDARPALDVALPAASSALPARLDFLLDDLLPVAVEVCDAAAERTGLVVRRVHFAAADDRDAARRAIARALGPDGASVRAVDVPDEDWAARSQANLRAIRVGRVVVAPPWNVPGDGEADGCAVVVIEPSTGFGTGHHASTRLCLRALQVCLDGTAAPPDVLDLGTGSGVLAIAAHKLGAAPVVAVDRDADALANARVNLARNAAGHAVALRQADVARLAVPGAMVVTANLSGAALVRHASRIARHVRASGSLIAGGVTSAEEEQVRAAFDGTLTPAGRETEDGWVALTLRRGSPP